jgi:hypothetical protein
MPALPRQRPARLAGALLGVVVAGSTLPARAADWLFAAGPTRSDGGAVEIARTTPRWEVAAGYVSSQRVNVITVQEVCLAQPVGLPVCEDQTTRSRRDVDGYGYLSLQRRFSWRDDRFLRPVIGVGAVALTDKNPYVSSPVTFSLSAGLRFGQRVTLEWRHFSNAGLEGPNLGQDMLLLRGRW